MMFVVLAVSIMIAFTIAIPFVTMFDSTARAFPVAMVEPLAIMAWSDPASALIRRQSPVTFVPAVMMASGVPISVNPNISGPGLRRNFVYDVPWRWRADSDTYRNLGACSTYAEQKHRSK